MAVYIHVTQHVRTTNGVEISMLAKFESSSHPDIVELALCEVASFGVLATAPRYDQDVDTFFVKVKPSDNRSEIRVEGVSALINQQIKRITAERSSQQPPNHHGDREAHAELG